MSYLIFQGKRFQETKLPKIFDNKEYFARRKQDAEWPFEYNRLYLVKRWAGSTIAIYISEEDCTTKRNAQFFDFYKKVDKMIELKGHLLEHKV